MLLEEGLLHYTHGKDVISGNSVCLHLDQTQVR